MKKWQLCQISSLVKYCQNHTKNTPKPYKKYRKILLSACFWIAAIYCVFMFQKVKDMETGEEWVGSVHTEEDRSRKRRSEDSYPRDPPKVPRNT